MLGIMLQTWGDREKRSHSNSTTNINALSYSLSLSDVNL